MNDDIVFLLDVDNTLLDNDRIVADLRHQLEVEFGMESASHYWKIFETLRNELGYADYLGALQRYRNSPGMGPAAQQKLLGISDFLLDYPFARRLFPGALNVIRYLGALGRTVILSDGDVVFQPRKILRSGLWDEVDGHVLIYVHKEKMLDDMQRHYPAQHYVVVDDKLRLLDSVKTTLQERVTTIFVRQGHYAAEVADVTNLANLSTLREADITVDHIGDLIHFDLAALTCRVNAGAIQQELP